jgi:hypothetical protein
MHEVFAESLYKFPHSTQLFIKKELIEFDYEGTLSSIGEDENDITSPCRE